MNCAASALAMTWALGAATSVHAADTAATAAPAGEVGEVVVTAQRREQSLMKVPVAVTALNGDALAQKGVTNSGQLSSVVPNLQVNSSFGDTQPNFSLRGVSVANEYNSNQVSPVGVYINDVYIAPRTSQGMGLFDLDRVEVLRGPQGTLFGRNTTGGAINFITHAPRLAGSEGYVEAGYGSFDTVKVQAAGETTLDNGQLGVRGAINFAKGNGEFQNVYPGGRDPQSTDSLQGRLTVRYRPNDGRLDLKLTAYGGRTDPTAVPVFGLDAARAGLGFFQVDENRVGEFKTYADGVSANVAYSLNDQLKLISITSYDTGGQDLHQAADGSPADILDIEWKSRFDQVSEEARLNYTGQKLTLIAGVYFGQDITVTDNTFYIGEAEGFFQHYRQRRWSTAVFAQGDYALTDHLNITLGIRYTADRAQYRDGQAYLFLGPDLAPGTPVATTVPCAGAPGTCAYDPAARLSLNGGNNAPTGRAAISYTFDNGVLAYASYSRGYRAGAFNGGGYTSSSGITYIQPETVNAYETGLKGRFFDRRLSLAIAGFYYDYRNQQLQDTRPGPVSFLVNAPKSEIYGAEAEAALRLLPGLNLNAALGLLHAKYQTLTLQGANLAGKDLPFSPHFTAQFGFDWRVAQVLGGDVTLAADVHYVSHQWFSPFNAINATVAQDNAALSQGAYSKTNASLAWKRNGLTVRAWVDNMFQAKTLGYGLDLRGAGFPYNYLVPEAPRTFGVAVRQSF